MVSLSLSLSSKHNIDMVALGGKKAAIPCTYINPSNATIWSANTKIYCLEDVLHNIYEPILHA